MTTDSWGITDGFHDIGGTWHTTTEETRATIRACMGDAHDSHPPPAAWVVRQGQTPALDGDAELLLEDGAVLRASGQLPADLPLGYHRLRRLEDERELRLIVAPSRCHLPEGTRIWGWAAQLYAARSNESWGIGDLADLRRLARWSAQALGAGMLLINPLSAATPVSPLQPSPYYPSSRRFRNPIYLRVEEVPGARTARIDLERVAAAGRALNEVRRIDRDAVWKLKAEALERLWTAFGGDERFERYRREHGRALRDFATFCALAERHGAGWGGWPAEFQRPDAPGVAAFAARHAQRIGFHEWLQWNVEEQLERAAPALRLMQDLPIGVDPGGADAWAWQDVLTTRASVGAPPDRYNPAGQDWGLPPFVPHRLAADAYEPFVQTIRAGLRHAGGLRIDHVMGLFRLFWIPRGSSPHDGAYVRYPAHDLLAIVALESQRAGAIVVGEDLGTVEAGVRERLAEHAILSYRVVWFEPDAPARYPELALAAVTTHDLPTVAGLWTGADIDAQASMGREPNRAVAGETRERLRRVADVAEDAPVAEVIERIHERLGQAPSAIVTATLDDALAVVERPNLPGTVDEWPNWSLALPEPLESIEQADLPKAIARALARGRGR